MDLVIGTKSNPTAVDRLIRELKAIALTKATLYVGYPILTCVEHGIVIFDLDTPKGPPNWQAIEDRQGELVIGLKSKLIRHKDLTQKRDLAVPIHVVT